MGYTRRLFLNRLSLCFFVAALAAPAAGQPIPVPRPTAIPVAIESGTALRARANLSGVSGWMVVDLDTGEVLDQHSAARPFAPASVAKLPTAAFALDALGPAHRFETRVLATGPVRGGRVEGDLILAGGGDPELDTDAILPLVRHLRERGVSSVAGRFLTDGSALPQLEEIEPGQAEHAAYNPSVSGLNLNFNRVHVKWDARKGRKKTLTVEAEAQNLSPEVQTVRVAVAETRGQPLFTLDRRGGQEHWQMAREAFRGRAARWLPVKKPEPYAGEVFRTIAAEHGLIMRHPETGIPPARATVLARHQSRPLAEILRSMLRFSTNLTAEVAGATAARALGQQVSTLVDSAAVMNAWAASVAGFRPGDPEFRLLNHSGLSLAGRVSPRRMVALLQALARRAPAPGAAHERLPGAIAGYLRRREVKDKATPLDFDRLDVVAKTGTMNYVRGLAGYIATPKGRRLAFAIFSNDLALRSARGERVNRGWMGRAKRFERALIRNWVLAADKERAERAAVEPERGGRS